MKLQEHVLLLQPKTSFSSPSASTGDECNAAAETKFIVVKKERIEIVVLLVCML